MTRYLGVMDSWIGGSLDYWIVGVLECWIIGVPGQWSYKTHKGSFVKVHYPWHPLYNCEVQVLNLIRRGGDSFYSVRLSDASCLFVPSWMTDEAYCQGFVIAPEAHCSVQALLRLHQLLEALGSSGGE